MNLIFDYLGKVCNNIAYLLYNDFDNFKGAFPHTYWLFFFLLRVVPFLAVIVLLFRFMLRHKATIQKGFERLKQAPYVTDTFITGHRPSSKFLFAFIFVLAAALRIWFAMDTPLIPIEGDAVSRLQQAKEWYDHPHSLMPGGLVWLPLHHWIIGLPYLLGFDIFWGSRYITLLFGLLTFPVFYVLVKERFNETIALLGCLLLAVNPFHIKFSVITMSEVPFIFLALSALLCLFRFIEGRKMYWLVLASICLNCCNLIRFEGWILSAFLPFFLVYYKKDWKHFLLFGAMNGFTILIYMAISYNISGHLIEGLSISDLTVKNAFAVRKDPTAYILRNLSWGFVFPLWMGFFFIYGGLLALKEKKEIPWLFAGSFLIGITAWKMINHSSEPFWRYLSTGLFLLLPFAVMGMAGLMKKNVLIRLLLIPVVLIYSAGDVASQYQLIQRSHVVPDGFYDAVNWLKAHHQKGQNYIYCSSADYSSFLLLMNATSGQVYHPYPPETKIFSFYENFTDTVLLRELNSRKYRYMVYQNGSVIDSVFHLPSVQNQIRINGLLPDSVYGNTNYRIFSLKSPLNPPAGDLKTKGH